MEITAIIASYTISFIVLFLTFSTLVLTVKLYLNLLKYKEAALGLIFTQLSQSIMAFKLLAVAVLIFAIGRLIDLFNIISASHQVDNVATVLYLITDIILIISFYKLLTITTLNKWFIPLKDLIYYFIHFNFSYPELEFGSEFNKLFIKNYYFITKTKKIGINRTFISDEDLCNIVFVWRWKILNFI